MTDKSRRSFLKDAGLVAAGAVVGGGVASGLKKEKIIEVEKIVEKAPDVVVKSNPIKWRLQTYSGAPLGKEVILPQIENFNQSAYGEMEIELYYADQLVPTDELFRAMQAGTLDAVQSDDATMGSPVDISVFGGYFPFATRYSLDVPAMFRYYGLDKVWAEAYGEVDNVTWLSTSAWDPCHIFTVNKKITSLADLKGLRVFGVPTAGAFMAKYGLIPVIIPWDDVEVAMQTGELDGVAWCGFTEAYEVGWADICNYALTNAVTGAWFGSYFANSKSWNALSPKLQAMFKMSIDQSHFHRATWYWGGEAKLRVEGKKMELTSIPANEWAQVVKDAEGFWEENSDTPRKKMVVDAFKLYAANMEKAGYPYR